ncbi:MAG: phnC [Rhodospirillales bacterium]|nr:phnC [Rhodospirillales bacterium]
MPPAIEIVRLSKSFTGARKALHDIDLRIEPGEMVALIGASGSGKSTLLRHISGLVACDRPKDTPAQTRHGVREECGEVRVHGALVQSGGRVVPDIRLRRGDIGFVFQQFNLVGRLSLQRNVETGALRRLPLWRSLTGWFPAVEKQRALEALERVGIARYAQQRASTLSGGQQQRAAIARALVQRARVLLADEPIASLDPKSCTRVMETLSRINREDGITVVVSLHQVDYATAYCPRVVGLRDGRVVYDGPSSALTQTLLAAIYGGEPEPVYARPSAALLPLHAQPAFQPLAVAAQ